MPDMAFALDSLYAAGWWPGAGDDCRRAPDDRWYPSVESIRQTIAESGTKIEIVSSHDSHPITVRMRTPRRGVCTITARSLEIAMIMAFSQQYATLNTPVLTH